MLYRVTKVHGSNQGYWETHRIEVVYVGSDKEEAFKAYLQLEPESGCLPGSHGYRVEFDSCDINDADHPDDLVWASEV